MDSVGRSFASRGLWLGLALLLWASAAASAPPLAAPDPRALAPKSGRPKRGPSAGLRTGWAFPFGERLGNEAMNDTYVGLLPFWLDAGYRLSPSIYIGAYFQYGILFITSSLCQPPLESCRGHDLRGGVNAHYYLRPQGPVDPWFGAGIGYEATKLTIEGTEQSASRTVRRSLLFVAWIAGKI